jgi:hypothetical protein
VTTLAAFYDLAVGPVSFDFAVFLTKARMAAARAKADRLHVVIVPFADGVAGMFRDKSRFYDEHESRWRLHNIVIPCCALGGASHSLATDWEQARAIANASDAHFPADWNHQTLKDRRHLVGDVITASRAGESVPRLHASEYARRAVRAAWKKPYVTMTLRKTYLAERNSDEAVWAAAGEHILKAGYDVRVLADTSSAVRAGAGYGELNLDLRMACYEEAALNLQANNGAASLCWFSDAPYRMFGANEPAEEWDGLFVKQGLPLGHSWPWAGAQQRIVYGRESASQMIGEFESWRGSVS